AEHANFSRTCRRHIATEPTPPFLSVDDKAGRVNRIAAPGRRVMFLSRSEFRLGEAIAPPEAVPIINVKRHGNDLLPQVLIRFECAQPFSSRWTTATSLRSKEFDERALRLATLKC